MVCKTIENDIFGKLPKTRYNPTKFPYFFDLLQEDEIDSTLFFIWKYYSNGGDKIGN